MDQDKVKYKILFEAGKVLYSEYLRPFVEDKVKSSPNKVDDFFLKIGDFVFQYKE